MSVLYSILGLIALSVVSVVALPILLVVFISGIAGAVTIFTRPEIKKIKLEQPATLSRLSPSEQAQG
jgi:hypothetical protein